MTPEVTVVIPTYARANAIGPSLAGALAQRDVDLEVVVVDDHSPDDTAERLRQLGEPRLRVVRHDRNMGVAVARATGIEAARGEWVAFLDDDDLWAPDKLRRQIDDAERKGATTAYSTAIVVDSELQAIEYHRPPEESALPQEILVHCCIPAGASNVTARRELIDEVGGVDTAFGPLADWDLFTRLFLAGKTAVSDDCLLAYVLYPDNMSSANLVRHFADFDRLEDKYRQTRAQCDVRLDGVTFSRWLASGQRRGGRRLAAMRAYLRGARRYRNVGNLARAAAVPFGEQLMRAGRRAEDVVPDLGPDPEWLDLYRDGGALSRREPSVPIVPSTA